MQNYLTMLRHLPVVLLLAGEVTSRGPANPPPLEDQLTWGYMAKRIGGELLSVLVVLGVLALAVAIGVCLCYLRVLWLHRHDNTVLCYLCQRRAKKRDWESGEHRKKCATRRQEMVKKMPQHPTEKCPKCDEFLRLWPKQGDLEFFCALSDNHPGLDVHGKIHPLVNDGHNRYNFGHLGWG